MMRPLFVPVLVGALLQGVACTESTAPSGPIDDNPLACELPSEFIVDGGVGRGGIPTLQNPEFISAEPSIGNVYLKDGDRVVGVILGGVALAIPHNILWYHEIVNLDQGGEEIAITYCPLTGSSMGFDRSSIGGQELGVSGVLFMNNLIMFNRGDPESLWPQMLGEARCGASVGQKLARYPVFEMTWRAWKELYPETTVITSDVNISRDYTLYPYGPVYELPENDQFLFSNMPSLDTRRLAKERVLGLPPTPNGEPGIAFPFMALDEQVTSWTVVETTWDGDEVVILWSDQFQGAGAFLSRHPITGDPLQFMVTDKGIEDTTTGTAWSIAGRGLEGPLVGEVLAPIAETYVAFWGAWAAFHPTTRLWEGG